MLSAPWTRRSLFDLQIPLTHIVMMSGGCVAHRSKAHTSVMLSSAATEYYEASEGCRELTYIRGILEDFYGSALPPTPMYIDNEACIAMGKTPVFSERQEHIPIRMCHLKECCAEKLVSSVPIALQSNLKISALRRFLSLPLFFSVMSFWAKLLLDPFKDCRHYSRGLFDIIRMPYLSHMQLHLFAHM